MINKRKRERSELSIELYYELQRRGYPEQFCDEVSFELNTDYTARRMLGYLNHYQVLPMVDVADEVLAILSDRETYVKKKIMEHDQAKWNEFMYYGLDADDGDEDRI